MISTAATKWNFARFEPGLVGGHCIGVDPYYLTYVAEQAGISRSWSANSKRRSLGMNCTSNSWKWIDLPATPARGQAETFQVVLGDTVRVGRRRR